MSNLGTDVFSRETSVKDFGLFILKERRLCKDKASISEDTHGMVEGIAQTYLEGQSHREEDLGLKYLRHSESRSLFFKVNTEGLNGEKKTCAGKIAWTTAKVPLEP